MQPQLSQHFLTVCAVKPPRALSSCSGLHLRREGELQISVTRCFHLHVPSGCEGVRGNGDQSHLRFGWNRRFSVTSSRLLPRTSEAAHTPQRADGSRDLRAEEQPKPANISLLLRRAFHAHDKLQACTSVDINVKKKGMKV